MPGNLDATISRALPTPSRPFLPPQPSGPGGFTLIELLVVIGVIAILAAIFLPALATIKDRAKRIKCLANTKQFNLAFVSYGHDNNDRLPTVTSGDWACQITIGISQLMLAQYGLTRDVLYCPAFPEFNNDPFWFNTLSGNWGPHRTIGYCNSLAGTHNVLSNFWVSSIAPQLVHDPLTGTRSGYNHFTMPSTITLVADIVPSLETTTSYYTNNGFVTVGTGNFYFDYVNGEDGVGDGTGPVPVLRANHMAPYQAVQLTNSDGYVIYTAPHLPAGGNEGFLDGSAHWVKFEKMSPRTSPVPDDPVFWW